MAGYIYYMYSRDKTIGYIGQSSRPVEELERIKEHIQAYKMNNTQDGAVRLIKKEGFSNIRYKIFKKDSYYGLSQDVYNQFMEYWSYNGRQTWDELTDQEQLDIAEMLHILKAKLENSNAANYNTLMGGFNANSKGTLELKMNLENAKKSGIGTTEFEIIKSKRSSMKEGMYSVHLENGKKEWKKIVYPWGYIPLETMFRPALIEYLKNNFWTDVITTREFANILINVLGQAIYSSVDGWKNGGKQYFVNKIKTMVNNALNKQDSKIRKNIIGILRQTLGNNYVKKFHIKWEFDDYTANIIDEQIIQTYVDRISYRMVQSLIKMIFSEKDGKRIADLNQWTNITKKFNSQSKPTDVELKFDLNKIAFVNFDIDKNKLPQWAITLMSIKLQPESMDWTKICSFICEIYFPDITQIAAESSREQWGYINQYSLPQNKPEPLISKVKNRLFSEGNRFMDFLNPLLTVWHKWQYGNEDWITLGIYKNDEEQRDNDKLHYIANPIIINNLESINKIWWYSGKAWEEERNKVGSVEKDFNSAGKALARIWYNN